MYIFNSFLDYLTATKISIYFCGIYRDIFRYISKCILDLYKTKDLYKTMYSQKIQIYMHIC